MTSLNVWLEAGTDFVFRTPYNATLVDRIRGLQGRRWDHDRKVWLVPGRHAQQVANIVADYRLLADDSAAARWDATRAALVDAESLATATTSDFDAAGLAKTLRPFQRAAVKYVIEKRRVLIADDMGLGKTAEAIASVHTTNAYPALVVCPAVLKENWRREILAWTPGATVQVLSGIKPQPITDAQWIICNYDIVHSHAPHIPTPAALVCDESHYAKESTSRRTRAVVSISERMPDDSIRLCLSGTPVMNRPSELIEQLRILGQLDAFGGEVTFGTQFCGRRYERLKVGGGSTRRILRMDGATNLAVLNTLLKQRCYIRRQKADVLTELPPKVRSVHWGNETPELYLREERHAKEELKAKATKLAESMNVSLADLMAAQEWVGFCSNEMGMLAKLRRALAIAKTPMVIAVAESMLESVDKLVIFGHHRELTSALIDHFGCPGVIGGMPDRQRQAAVDAFQAADGPRVIVCSIQAAGVGLTLHAASNALMAELAWTPAVLDQAEDRLHRLGQRDSVTAWYTLCRDTIDERIWELLEKKRGIAGDVTDGSTQAELVKLLVSE